MRDTGERRFHEHETQEKKDPANVRHGETQDAEKNARREETRDTGERRFHERETRKRKTINAKS